jgi:hypothetical protein
MGGLQSLQPVPDFTVSSDLHLVATLITIVVWLGVLAAAIRLGRRHATLLPLLMLAGGAITYGFEPIVDTLGKCWLPETEQWTLFTAFNRDMPVYGVFVYSAFFGGFSMMSWNHLRSGGEARGLWKLFAIAIFVNAMLFESPAIWANVYTYYGDQPWDLWGFPLWWPFVNTAGPLAAGALAYVLDARVRLDRRWLLAVAFISEPVFDGMSNGFSGMPTWIALNSEVPVALVWVAGTITMLLGCLFVFATVRAVEWVQRHDLVVDVETERTLSARVAATTVA